jgi:hypothetical protein
MAGEGRRDGGVQTWPAIRGAAAAFGRDKFLHCLRVFVRNHASGWLPVPEMRKDTSMLFTDWTLTFVAAKKANVQST